MATKRPLALSCALIVVGLLVVVLGPALFALRLIEHPGWILALFVAGVLTTSAGVFRVLRAWGW